MIALALVLELSWDTQASDRPVLVHSVVFAVAIFLALVAWKGVARWALAGMAVTLALLVWWSAVRHPDLVLNAAEDVAAGRPHCIALANRKRAARRSDLTFLTMDKMKYPRHALLIIAGEDEGETRHWSYHRKAWLQRGGPLDGWRCTP